ncbi:MAG: SPOR domain-containing protein [Candidatus Delongbacteria bacterium]
MRGRIDHLLELARLAGKVLLSYSVAAWLLYLLVGMLLPSLLVRGSPLTLIGGLVLALPAPLLLFKRSRTRHPNRLAQAWEALDRRDPAGLAAFHELLQQQTGLTRTARTGWEERLLDAWRAAPAPLDDGAAASLRDLLFIQERLGPEARELLLRLSGTAVAPLDLLRLWNRAEAGGLAPDPRALAEACRAFGPGALPRGLRSVKALLFRLVRDNHPEGRALLVALLEAGRLRGRDLPPDLKPVFAHLAATPAAASSSPLAGIPFLRYLSLGRARLRGVTGRNRLGAGWKWGVVLGVIALAAGLSRLLEKAPPPMQAPPQVAFDYAPPADVEAGFTLQILASRDSSQTAAYVQRLHGDGRYAYALAPRSNSSYYRVRLGWFLDRAAADSVASLLRQRGVIDEWYVANFDREGRLFETLLAPPDSTADSTRTEH